MDFPGSTIAGRLQDPLKNQPQAPSLADYVSSLPASVRPHLEQRLDWDHEGVDKDLSEIAEDMLGWEEELSTHFELTTVNIEDIKTMHSNPVLQR